MHAVAEESSWLPVSDSPPHRRRRNEWRRSGDRPHQSQSAPAGRSGRIRNLRAAEVPIADPSLPLATSGGNAHHWISNRALLDRPERLFRVRRSVPADDDGTASARGADAQLAPDLRWMRHRVRARSHSAAGSSAAELRTSILQSTRQLAAAGHAADLSHASKHARSRFHPTASCRDRRRGSGLWLRTLRCTLLERERGEGAEQRQQCTDGDRGTEAIAHSTRVADVAVRGEH